MRKQIGGGPAFLAKAAIIGGNIAILHPGLPILHHYVHSASQRAVWQCVAVIDASRVSACEPIGYSASVIAVLLSQADTPFSRNFDYDRKLGFEKMKTLCG